MKYLLDDVVRTLATPMPRRKTFRLLGGLLAGGILGGMGLRPAFADQGPLCGHVHCSSDEKCCNPPGNAAFCLEKSATCPPICGDDLCAVGQVCCGKGKAAKCGDKCCGEVACDHDEKCCKNAPFCVDGDKPCPASEQPSD